MKQIVPGVYTLERPIAGRVYLIEDEDGLTLIDTSIPNGGNTILKELTKAGYAPQDVKRILITHAHPDHVGGLTEIKEATGAEVWCHELEKPVIEGELDIPRPPSGLRPPKTVLERVPVSKTIAEGDVLPVGGGLQVVFTPGHAPGHISFWQPEQRLLIVGDVLFYLFNRMTFPIKALTVDPEENRRSVKKLYDLKPDTLLFGHGRPLIGRAGEVFDRFVERVGLV